MEKLFITATHRGRDVILDILVFFAVKALPRRISGECVCSLLVFSSCFAYQISFLALGPVLADKKKQRNMFDNPTHILMQII